MKRGGRYFYGRNTGNYRVLDALSTLAFDYPPRALGVLDDMWSRHISDFGVTGPDKGKGGKFLIVPPGYKGKIPSGYHVARSRTNGVWAVVQGIAAGVRNTG